MQIDPNEKVVYVAIDVQKSLLKNKTKAFFDRYENGKLYYTVWYDGYDHVFPIKTVEKFDANISDGPDNTLWNSREMPDVKGAAFIKEMKGSELFRWIKKAIESDDFVRIYSRSI